MGSASSKATRGLGRKYPTAPSSVTSSNVAHGVKAGSHPGSRPMNDKSHDIRVDAMDPDAVNGNFSQRLQQMGVVQPNPTCSPSSTAVPYQMMPGPDRPLDSLSPTFTPSKTNPTLSALEARRQLQHQAEIEFETLGTSETNGRRFVDMRTLVDALALLDRGTPRQEVEKRLSLENGLLEKLGGPSILSHESTAS